MSNNILSGVVALVSCKPDGTFNFRQTISTKLTDLGARVTSRFSKDVTHVVFQKRLKPTPEQQVAEASDLRALYDKAAKASVSGQKSGHMEAMQTELSALWCRQRLQCTLFHYFGWKGLLQTKAGQWWVLHSHRAYVNLMQ